MIKTNNTEPLKPNLEAKEGPDTVLISLRFSPDTNTPKNTPRATFMSFNALPTLEELAREQGVSPVADPKAVRGDFWPEDESVDDFLEARKRWRREGQELDNVAGGRNSCPLWVQL